MCQSLDLKKVPETQQCDPLLWIITGEPSGDFLGGEILKILRKRHPSLRIQGIGGSFTEHSGGFTSPFSYTELAHIGFVSVLKHFPRLFKRYRETVRAIRNEKPDVILTIDCPDFSLRVSTAVRGLGTRVHCVAPSVWAWRKGRSRHLSRKTDHLLHLFRFEKRFFRHMQSSWVGHPLADQSPPDKNALWEAYPELIREHPLLCVLPGSRDQEIRTCWPVFLETVHKLQERMPELQVVVVTFPRYTQMIHPSRGIVVVTDDTIKRSTFSNAIAALACSGTVTLELALENVPMVIGYAVSPWLAWILRKIVTTPYVGLVNILAGKMIAKECLQDQFTPEILTKALWPLITRSHPSDAEIRGLLKIKSEVKTPKGFAITSADIIERALYKKT